MATRLETFLESFGPENVKRSVSTTSVYYGIYGQIFRIADHKSDNREIDVQIILATNNEDIFIVLLKNGIQFLAFSFAELKVFLSNYILIYRVSHPQLINGEPIQKEEVDLEAVDKEATEVPLLTDPDVPSNGEFPTTVEPVVEEEKPAQLAEEGPYLFGTNVSLNSPERASTNELYGILAEKHIIPVYPTWRELSNSTKKQLRDLFRLNISFDECIKLLRKIILQTRAPKRVEALITRYQNEHNC